MIAGREARISEASLWIWLSVVGGVAGGLRLFRIGSQSLWIDEADMYLRAAAPTLRQCFGNKKELLTDPLHPFLLHFWLKLGSSDANARLLSAIFGILTIFVLYKLVADNFGTRLGLLSAGLLAINPFHIWYSQEARMYSLFLFLVVLSTWLLYRALGRSDRRPWMDYGVTLLLMGLTHQTAVFVGAVHAFCVVHDKAKTSRSLRAYLLTVVCVAIMLLPFYGLRAERTADTGTMQVDKPVGLLNLAYVFYSQCIGFSLGPSIYEIQHDPSISVVLQYWTQVSLASAVFLPLVALGLFGAWKMRSEPRFNKALVFCALMLLVPSVTPWIIDIYSNFTLNPRHAIASTIGLILLIALGILTLSPPLRVLFSCGILILSTWSLKNYYFNQGYAKEDARSAVKYLESLENHSLVVLTLTYPSPIRRYYHQSSSVFGPNDLPVSDPKTLDGALRSLVSGGQDLALVDLRAWHSHKTPQIKSSIARLFTKIETRAFHGLSVNIYRLSDPLAAEMP